MGTADCSEDKGRSGPGIQVPHTCVAALTLTRTVRAGLHACHIRVHNAYSNGVGGGGLIAAAMVSLCWPAFSAYTSLGSSHIQTYVLSEDFKVEKIWEKIGKPNFLQNQRFCFERLYFLRLY